MPSQRQITTAAHDHVLTNVNCFSPDSAWIVYDVRTRQGEAFDGDRIERVRVADGAVQRLYVGRDGAHVGVATYSPVADKVVFIHGPENPTPAFSYGPARRHGVMVDCRTGVARILDARNLKPPFTPGALRGGTHVHVFSPDGQAVSSTYEDHLLDQLGPDEANHDLNQRTIAVSVCGHSVMVDAPGPYEHDGAAFTFVAVRTTNRPRPGSDEIDRAFEDAWVGKNGYQRADGSLQRRALAFQGNVVAADGSRVTELFVVDLPDDPTRAGDGPIEGTSTRRPAPPLGCVQRRLTFTTARAFPGIQGPRHWVRSSPDGTAIAFLLKDDSGVVQIWTISPNGGEPRQLTRNVTSIASAFTWSPDSHWIAHLMDGSICRTATATGATQRLTVADEAIRPQACVFSPDGRSIAFVKGTCAAEGPRWDQVWLVSIGSDSVSASLSH